MKKILLGILIGISIQASITWAFHSDDNYDHARDAEESMERQRQFDEDLRHNEEMERLMRRRNQDC